MCAAEMENTNHQHSNIRLSKNDHTKSQPESSMMCAFPECISLSLKQEMFEVKYVSAHSNHTIGPSEDAFLPLPASTKEEIAMKLALGISIERIMDGNVNYCNKA